MRLCVWHFIQTLLLSGYLTAQFVLYSRLNSRINDALVRLQRLEVLLTPGESSKIRTSALHRHQSQTKIQDDAKILLEHEHVRLKREASVEIQDIATIHRRLQTLESSISVNTTAYKAKPLCPQGPPGLAGRDGLPGKAGLPGRDGLSGKAGLPGRDGKTGPPGRDGRHGSSGRDGMPGRDGSPGRDGHLGSPGLPGRNGDRGPKGDRGDMGPSGLSGPQGERGRRGKRGPPGPRGRPDIITATPQTTRSTDNSGATPTGQIRPDQKSTEVGGAVYTRWGRAECPGTGATLVYKGVVAGSTSQGTGGGSNYLCMPHQPYYARAPSLANPRAHMYGVEYGKVEDVFLRVPGRPRDMNYQGVPCAVCLALSRPSMIMVPARYVCPNKAWTREYHGYLMSPSSNSTRSQFVCVDADSGVVRRIHGVMSQRASLLTPVQGKCGALPCPHYRQDWDLTCAVCTT